jgi:hypothetical protein
MAKKFSESPKQRLNRALEQKRLDELIARAAERYEEIMKAQEAAKILNIPTPSSD